MAKGKPLLPVDDGTTPVPLTKPTAPRPFVALALRQTGGNSWQLVELTIQGSQVIREATAVPNMFPIAVGEFKAAAAKYFGEVLRS